MSETPIVVVGAGLQGLCSALALVERGEPVRVIERREGPALETSYANAGMLTPSLPDTWNSPGVGKHLLQSLGRNDSAMLLRVRALPSLLGWGLRFLRNSSPSRHRRATRNVFALAQYSLGATAALRESLGLEYEASTLGTLKLFRDRKAFETSLGIVKRLAEAGLVFRALDADGLVAAEPMLAPVYGDFFAGLHFPGDECGDAHLFCQALAAQLEARGVRVETGVEVKSLRCHSGHVQGLELADGVVEAERVVVAAGCWSHALVRSAGLRLPVRPAKGYSLTVEARHLPERPALAVLDDHLHIAVVPLGTRLRIAGTAEFAGMDPRIRAPRVQNLVDHFLRIYPELAAELELRAGTTWAGLRPMSADGLPLIGETAIRGLYLNTGHGQLGWTLAVGSGQVLADLVIGNPPGVEPNPYLASRAL